MFSYYDRKSFFPNPNEKGMQIIHSKCEYCTGKLFDSYLANIRLLLFFLSYNIRKAGINITNTISIKQKLIEIEVI